MSFNLNDASEKITTTYQTPGIATVEITGVLLEKTKANQVPYIKLVTKNENGDIGHSSQMFLSTEKKEGKTMAAWNVTARNLVDILMSAHNCDEATAKGMIVANTQEELQTKLSARLVGRKVRAKFKGETSQKNNVFAILSQTESASVPLEQSRLKFDKERDIKPFQGVPQSSSQPTFETADKTEDLPF